MKVVQAQVLLLLLAAAPTSFAFTPPTVRTLHRQHFFSSSSSSSARSSSSTDHSVDCLVVGGGISGATLAHNLYRNHGITKLLLAEARDYLGGNVKSHITEDGFIWEQGPNSFATQPSIVRIAHELGIANQLVFADESLPPWVYHNGKLHPLPKGLGSKGAKGQLELIFGRNGVLKFALAGELLDWPGKIRAGIGAFLGHAPPPPDQEETIREWVTRILGNQVFLRCIDPFVSGVYAGNPETLSMKAALPKIARIEDISYGLEWNKWGAIFYGGLARQVELTKERKADPPDPAWPEFEYGNPGSFRQGLSTLPNAIQDELGGDVIKLEWKLTKIEKLETNDYKYKATFETPTGVQTVQTKTIVSTVPAHSLAPILKPIMPEVCDGIFEKVRAEINRIGIYHPPVAAVTVAYPKSAFQDVELSNGFGNLQTLPGFGSLNPRTEGVRTLGTLWSSSLFPGRAPPDYHLLLNYIGGSRDVGIADMSEDEIVAEVDKGCRQVLLKDNAPPPKVLGVKVWPTAIPQYELGHLPLMEELREAEAKVPGVWVCGNYRTGVAFPDCVTFGYEQAKVVKEFLDQMAATTLTTAEASTGEASPVEAKSEELPTIQAGTEESVKLAESLSIEAEAVKSTPVEAKSEESLPIEAEAEVSVEAEADESLSIEDKSEKSTPVEAKAEESIKAEADESLSIEAKSEESLPVEAEAEESVEAKSESLPIEAESEESLPVEAEAKESVEAKSEESLAVEAETEESVEAKSEESLPVEAEAEESVEAEADGSLSIESKSEVSLPIEVEAAVSLPIEAGAEELSVEAKAEELSSVEAKAEELSSVEAKAGELSSVEANAETASV